MSIQFCDHYLLTSVYFSLKKHIYLLGTLTISLKLSLSIFTFTSYFSLFLFCQRSPKIRKQHYWRYIPLLGDHNLTPYNHSKNRPVWRDVDYHKRLECLPHHQLVWKWNGTAHNSTNDIRAKVMGSSYGSVIVREGLLGGDHNLTPYNHSKNRHMWRDVECHKRFECVFLITNWF